MGLGAKQHRNLEAQLRDLNLKSCDRDFMHKTNRSGSVTPYHDDCDNLTEEDDDDWYSSYCITFDNLVYQKLESGQPSSPKA